MKFLQSCTLIAALTGATLITSTANAELIANIPPDTSRFERMDNATLTQYAGNGNTQAQFFWQNAYKKDKALLVIPPMPSIGTRAQPNKALRLHS